MPRSIAYALAFVLLAIGMGLAIQSQARKDAVLLRDASIKACQRDNHFRREDNKRGNILRALVSNDRTSINKNSSRKKRTDLPALKPINIKDIPLTNCIKAYPKP